MTITNWTVDTSDLEAIDSNFQLWAEFYLDPNMKDIFHGKIKENVKRVNLAIHKKNILIVKVMTP